MKWNTVKTHGQPPIGALVYEKPNRPKFLAAMNDAYEDDCRWMPAGVIDLAHLPEWDDIERPSVIEELAAFMFESWANHSNNKTWQGQAWNGNSGKRGPNTATKTHWLKVAEDTWGLVEDLVERNK